VTHRSSWKLKKEKKEKRRKERGKRKEKQTKLKNTGWESNQRMMHAMVDFVIVLLLILILKN
jgi:hypothetical protein